MLTRLTPFGSAPIPDPNAVQPGCPSGQWQTTTNGVVSCSASMPTGLIVGLTVGGLLIASMVALGFYQAYKGIRPVYRERGMNVYL